ncbi:MAG TPA: cell division protein FtsL [Acidimicrobiales bacterium]|nr:cell division protein FtsL [Acidimicrobiales bacterium]
MAVRAPDRRLGVEPGRRAHPAGTGRPARPRLRVVPPNSLSPAARRRRGRLVAVVLSGAVVIGLLAIVALHALLSQNQLRLDDIDAKAAAQQARYERLRLEVAELESPSRIVATAQQKLGMVMPPTVTYLTPTGTDESQATPPAGAAQTSAPARPPSSQTTPDTWSAVKPYLADHP